MPQAATRNQRRAATLNPIHDTSERQLRKKRKLSSDPESVELIEVDRRSYSKMKSDAIIAKDYLQRSQVSHFDPEGALLTNMVCDILKEAKLTKTLKTFQTESTLLTKSDKLLNLSKLYFEHASELCSEKDKTSSSTSDDSCKEKENNSIVEVKLRPIQLKKLSPLNEDDLEMKLKAAGVIPDSLKERVEQLERSLGQSDYKDNIPSSIFSRLKYLEDNVLDIQHFMKGE